MRDAEARLATLGLEDHARKLGSTLSYGDRRRLEVALALACEPQLLILDEPTAGMSLSDKPGMVELIRTVSRQRGVTVVLIEHDMRRFERSRLGLGYVPEDRRIFPELTVRENLDTTVKSASDSVPWTLERAFDLFPALGGMQKRAGGLLSGGEQQMLSIARTPMGNPEVKRAHLMV